MTRGSLPAHLATSYVDRMVALRKGRLVEDARAHRLDAQALEPIDAHEAAAGSPA